MECTRGVAISRLAHQSDSNQKIREHDSKRVYICAGTLKEGMFLVVGSPMMYVLYPWTGAGRRLPHCSGDASAFMATCRFQVRLTETRFEVRTS